MLSPPATALNCVDFFNEIEIEIGQATAVMRRRRYLGVAPAECYIGMMVGGFGDLTDAVDKGETLGKIRKTVAANEPIFNGSPSVQLLKFFGDLPTAQTPAFHSIYRLRGIKLYFEFRLLSIAFCMRLFNLSSLVVFAGLIAALAMSCTSEREPATPVKTFKTYVKAAKQKDITTMKLLLSDESLKMHEQEARTQNVTVDDIVKRETLLGEGQTTVEYRNEKIDGNKATVEFKNSIGTWNTMPFVFEDGEWKIDKRAFAEQMIMDVEQDSRQFDEMLNRGRQPN